jgi:hypothetical protein
MLRLRSGVRIERHDVPTPLMLLSLSRDKRNGGNSGNCQALAIFDHKRQSVEHSPLFFHQALVRIPETVGAFLA